ncbi:MAG: hypothetical protein BM555_06740 [Crocinitomix sp. MedPE-SWsnd]|nr:MAG: hypothetical protein BM555_06740 [Crocinitomix sp. MedPE-SWsnd]
MAQQVSIESIEKALSKIDSLDEAALDKLIETYTLDQQNLVDYVLQAGLEYENEDLNVFSIYYFAVITEAFYQQELKTKELSTEEIEAFHEPYLLALDAVHTSEDYEPMNDLIQQHNLQQFIIEEVEAPDSDGVILDEATQTQLFIVVISIIGLLNSSVSD